MRVPLTLYLVALAACALTGFLHPAPAYPDSAYYVAVAHSLASGHGFTVDYIWNFVDVGGRVPPDALLPIPSNAYWMPLASLVQVPFILQFGTTPLASVIPFVLIGATAAPLAWAIGRDAGLTSQTAIAAGLMTAVPGAFAQFLGQPDNFDLFMPLGALALWLCARGLRGDPRAFVLGGFVVGLATLARNDGILLGVPFALGWLRQTWMARPRRQTPSTATSDGTTQVRLSLVAGLACFLAFLIVMGPWYARQLATFGSLSPSLASGRILWITNFGEFFSVSGQPSLASFLAQGWEALLRSRLNGFTVSLEILAVLPFLFFLVPFVLWAAWSRRRSDRFGPWFAYAIALLVVSGLVFAVYVPYGSFPHSAVALLPHGYVLAAEGIALAVAWTGQRLRHWDVPRATRNLTALAVAVLWIGGSSATWKTIQGWDAEAAVRSAAAASLAELARPDDRLMSADPGAFRYDAGLGGIVTPADPVATIEAAARAYDIRWVVLERSHIVDSLVPVYLQSTPLPSWLVQVREEQAPADQGQAGGPATAAPPVFRIYAACLSPADPRAVCQAGLR